MKRRFLIAFVLGFAELGFAQNAGTGLVDTNAVKEYFFAGLKEKLNENYSAAGQNFTKVIALDPNNDAALFELANSALQQNKLVEADLFIRKAIALKPNHIWYLKLQADVFKRNGNMDALIATLENLIKLDDTAEAYQFDKANALFILGKKEEAGEALTVFEQKFGISKASSLLKNRLSNNKVSDLKTLDNLPEDEKRYLDLSGNLVARKEYEEALKVLLKAQALAPDNFEVNLALADVFLLLKKSDNAFLELKKAFARNEMPLVEKVKVLNQLLAKPSSAVTIKHANELALIALNDYKEEPKILLLYGDVLYQQGNYNGAIAQYQNALKKGEQRYAIWEKLLGVQTLQGKYADAIATSEEAISMYPNQAILYYYRAFSLHRDGQNAAAGLALKNALQLDPDDQNLKAMILALQAEVFIDQSKFKDADIAFDKAVNLAPNNYLTISNYAYYLALRNHNLDKAELLAKRAALALPQNASVLDTYAVVLLKLNKYDEALKFILLALENNGADNPVYLEHYGDILFLKGQKEEALKQWEKAKMNGNQSEKLSRKINEKKYIK